MDKNKIKSEIAKAVRFLKKHLPASMHEKLLLTGGSAAFLYGSDRPFSNDIDFEITPEMASEIEKDFKVEFVRYKKKPVFHSLKAAFMREGESYDFIAESVIQPPSHSESYRIFLTDEVLGKKETVVIKGEKIFITPKELLVLIKLLAGRGQELGKYDLYDVWKIVSTNDDFDFSFFKQLVNDFCTPLKKSLPILVRNAEKIYSEHRDENIKRLSEALYQIQPPAGTD